MRIHIAPGNRGDVIYAAGLLDGVKAGAILADRAYDADHFRATVAAMNAKAVIPSRPDRSQRIACDFRLYRERNLVERLVGRLKQFRRVATRYDKVLAYYRGFVLIAAICLWLH